MGYLARNISWLLLSKQNQNSIPLDGILVLTDYIDLLPKFCTQCNNIATLIRNTAHFSLLRQEGIEIS